MEIQQPAESIDWAVVRSKLQRTFDALDVDLSEATSLMDERARVAAGTREETDAGDSQEIFTFSLTSLSGVQYGIEAHFVQEIFRFSDCAPIPGVEDFVVGITTLREEVLAVVDLRKFWGLPSTGMHDNAWVIAVGRERAEFGVLVDEIHEVKQVHIERLDAVDAIASHQDRTTENNKGASDVASATLETSRNTSISPELLWGAKGDLTVLRGERLLDDPRLLIYQEDLPLV